MVSNLTLLLTTFNPIDCIKDGMFLTGSLSNSLISSVNPSQGTKYGVMKLSVSLTSPYVQPVPSFSLHHSSCSNIAKSSTSSGANSVIAGLSSFSLAISHPIMFNLVGIDLACLILAILS